MRTAIGLTVHTGWGVAVVVAGTPAQPHVLAQARIEVLGDPDRFCYHRAAEMPRARVERWLDGLKRTAIQNATLAFKSVLRPDVVAAGIVAKDAQLGTLDTVLASHPRWHIAEACFYRDVFRAALPVPARLVSPSSLDAKSVGKLASPPWGRDQKLATLAGWAALRADLVH
jgi:hypothetical protein